MSEVPQDYNELVSLVENNDPGTVAEIIQENFTPNSKLQEKATSWRKEARKRNGDIKYYHCADELQKLIDE